MKKAFPLLLILISIACSRQQESDRDFIDKLLDLATATSNEDYLAREHVELTNLYDKLANGIPEDKDEKLILVERLKQRGFEVIDWGRGNFPPLGPRIVIVELKKGNCSCQVNKTYYSTVTDALYQPAEGISCKRTAP